jgi:hypothetical protein
MPSKPQNLFIVKTHRNNNCKPNTPLDYSDKIKQILIDKYSWKRKTFKVTSKKEGKYYFVEILDLNYFKDKLPTQNFNSNIEDYTLKFEIHKSLYSIKEAELTHISSSHNSTYSDAIRSNTSHISTSSHNSTYACVTASVKSDIGSYTPTPIRKPIKPTLEQPHETNIWTQFDGISHNQDIQHEIQNGTFFDIMKDTNDEKDIIIKQLQRENTKLKLTHKRFYKLIYSLYNIIKFNNNSNLSIFPRKEKIYYLNNHINGIK